MTQTLTHITDMSIPELDAALIRMAHEREHAGTTRRAIIGRIIDRVLEQRFERQTCTPSP